MPEIGEDILHQLMVRCTDDLFAPRTAALEAIRRQRRNRLRKRLLGFAGTAAAAGLAAGIAVTSAGTGVGARSSASASGRTGPAVRPVHAQLTAAQRTLLRLSAAAAGTPGQDGKYVILKEYSTSVAGGQRQAGGKTTITDTATGAGVEYQDITVSGAGAATTPTPPSVLRFGADSQSTTAYFSTLPTDPMALRAMFLAQANQEISQAKQALRGLELKGLQVFKKGGEWWIKAPTGAGFNWYRQVPGNIGDAFVTPDDMVFNQAASLLWEPNLSPALRAALYKVLAATPGANVKTGTADSSGRPAVEISWFDPGENEDIQAYEDPATGATLESAWTGTNGLFDEDLYLSVSYASSIPANPYHS
jgi:hypothetical protein